MTDTWTLRSVSVGKDDRTVEFADRLVCVPRALVLHESEPGRLSRCRRKAIIPNIGCLSTSHEGFMGQTRVRTGATATDLCCMQALQEAARCVGYFRAASMLRKVLRGCLRQLAAISYRPKRSSRYRISRTLLRCQPQKAWGPTRQHTPLPWSVCCETTAVADVRRALCDPSNPPPSNARLSSDSAPGKRAREPSTFLNSDRIP